MQLQNNFFWFLFEFHNIPKLDIDRDTILHVSRRLSQKNAQG